MGEWGCQAKSVYFDRPTCRRVKRGYSNAYARVYTDISLAIEPVPEACLRKVKQPRDGLRTEPDTIAPMPLVGEFYRSLRALITTINPKL
jgi:hypothetical protein